MHFTSICNICQGVFWHFLLDWGEIYLLPHCTNGTHSRKQAVCARCKHKYRSLAYISSASRIASATSRIDLRLSMLALRILRKASCSVRPLSMRRPFARSMILRVSNCSVRLATCSSCSIRSLRAPSHLSRSLPIPRGRVQSKYIHLVCGRLFPPASSCRSLSHGLSVCYSWLIFISLNWMTGSISV